LRLLNANYVMRAVLSDVMTPAFEGTVYAECLFDDRFSEGYRCQHAGNLAKARLDEGLFIQ